MNRKTAIALSGRSRLNEVNTQSRTRWTRRSRNLPPALLDAGLVKGASISMKVYQMPFCGALYTFGDSRDTQAGEQPYTAFQAKERVLQTLFHVHHLAEMCGNVYVIPSWTAIAHLVISRGGKVYSCCRHGVVTYTYRA